MFQKQSREDSRERLSSSSSSRFRVTLDDSDESGQARGKSSSNHAFHSEPISAFRPHSRQKHSVEIGEPVLPFVNPDDDVKLKTPTERQQDENDSNSEQLQTLDSNPLTTEDRTTNALGPLSQLRELQLSLSQRSHETDDGDNSGSSAGSHESVETASSAESSIDESGENGDPQSPVNGVGRPLVLPGSSIVNQPVKISVSRTSSVSSVVNRVESQKKETEDEPSTLEDKQRSTGTQRPSNAESVKLNRENTSRGRRVRPVGFSLRNRMKALQKMRQQESRERSSESRSNTQNLIRARNHFGIRTELGSDEASIEIQDSVEAVDDSIENSDEGFDQITQIVNDVDKIIGAPVNIPQEVNDSEFLVDDSNESPEIESDEISEEVRLFEIPSAVTPTQDVDESTESEESIESVEYSPPELEYSPPSKVYTPPPGNIAYAPPSSQYTPPVAVPYNPPVYSLKNPQANYGQKITNISPGHFVRQNDYRFKNTVLNNQQLFLANPVLPQQQYASVLLPANSYRPKIKNQNYSRRPRVKAVDALLLTPLKNRPVTTLLQPVPNKPLRLHHSVNRPVQPLRLTGHSSALTQRPKFLSGQSNNQYFKQASLLSPAGFVSSSSGGIALPTGGSVRQVVAKDLFDDSDEVTLVRAPAPSYGTPVLQSYQAPEPSYQAPQNSYAAPAACEPVVQYSVVTHQVFVPTTVELYRTKYLPTTQYNQVVDTKYYGKSHVDVVTITNVPEPKIVTQTKVWS